MNEWNWREWLKAALVRAVKTFAQTFASMIAVGAAASEVDWLRALSVSGVAFVLSMFTSLAGLPEVKGSGSGNGGNGSTGGSATGYGYTNSGNGNSEKTKPPEQDAKETDEHAFY